MFKCLNLPILCTDKKVSWLFCLAVSGLFFSASTVADISRESLQDPTRPLNYKTANSAGGGLALNSILHSAGRKQAVVNGKTVREKDYVAGAQVLRINADSVEMNVNGKRLILTLRQRVIKTPSGN